MAFLLAVRDERVRSTRRFDGCTMGHGDIASSEGAVKTGCAACHIPQVGCTLVINANLLCMLALQELGTSGNLDGQQRLIVKGRFLPKGFENVIRRYMNEYVLCASCKSPDTLLDRDAGNHP